MNLHLEQAFSSGGVLNSALVYDILKRPIQTI